MENGVANLAKEEFFGLDLNENTIGPTNIYHIETCMLQSLTVYKDRAELCRYVHPQLKVGKISMIVFKKISPMVDKDSFRVDVKGPGVIRDVYFRASQIPDDEKMLQEKKTEIQTEINSCSKKIKLLLSKQQRLRTQKSVIDGFSETLVEKRDADFKSKTSMFDPRHMETLSSFLKLYDNQVEKLDCDLMQTQDDIDDTQAKLDDLMREMDKLDANNNDKLSRNLVDDKRNKKIELTVMVECKDSEPVSLSVNYILFSCQWTPSYDIRIYSNDGNMKILYYGQITQNTGEDWCPETMFLSTALPGTGEHVPDLGGQSIKFKEVRRRTPKVSKSKRMTKALSFHSKDDPLKMSTGSTSSPRTVATGNAAMTTSTITEDAYMCFSDDNTGSIQHHQQQQLQQLHGYSSLSSKGDNYDSVLKSPMRDLSMMNLTPMHVSASTTNGLHCTGEELSISKVLPNTYTPPMNTASFSTPVVHFTVPRPPVISSTPANHEKFSPYTSSKENRLSMIDSTKNVLSSLPESCQRACVGVIDLHPAFEYFTVPRRTPFAFLKANCHNGSSYAILPGVANVFIDNNFIGKTTLGTVSPQEEFKVDLGVDQGIKIKYKPIYKYKESPHSSSSNRYNGMVFKQLIEIKNSHERNIKLQVKDQLPLSGEDKIKVHLQEPSLKNGLGNLGKSGSENEKTHATKQVKLMKSGIIEWNLELHPNELKELTLKYLVEYPNNEEIDVAFLKTEL